ncbi:uncharacterized protein [Periplaneta americana]|uniref:uncharacterized protein n=1 Tax=Periplaneta americana TaxID=6978 RepID=UPI0037E97EB9
MMHINCSFPVYNAFRKMLLVICAFFIALGQDPTAGDRDYVVNYDTAEVIKATLPFFRKKDCYLETEKYNSSYVVMNGRLVILETLPADTIITVGCHAKQDNNEYNQLFNETLPFCDYMVKHPELYGLFSDFSPLPKTCPVSPGKYDIVNGYADENRFPPEMHRDVKTWYIVIKLKQDKKVVLHLGVYVNIEFKN